MHCAASSLEEESLIKVAILILAHQNPNHLKRLVNALDDQRFDIFIHVDAKTNLADFQFDTYALQHSKLTILPNRHNIHWGDISMVDAMMALYRHALAADDYKWFIMLSGEDYPIQSNNSIYEHLLNRKDDNICISPLSPTVRVTGYWFFRLFNRFGVRVVRKTLHICGIRKKPYLIVDGERWNVCISSQWHALTHSSVRYLLSTVRENPCIRNYFRYSRAPDETMIPTILSHAPHFSKQTSPCYHDKTVPFANRAAIHYLEYNPHTNSTVTVFDESAYDAALSSGKLFIRKVREGKSDKLIAMLDRFRN